MTRLFFALLTLFFMSGPAIGENSNVRRCTLAAKSEALAGIRLNKAVGDATADAIASRYPFALREVPFETVGGTRISDVVPIGGRNVAIESKVGVISLDARIRQELARDWWLRRQGQVDDIMWEFTPSPITGRGGPTGPLLEKLNKLGVGVRINE